MSTFVVVQAHPRFNWPSSYLREFDIDSGGAGGRSWDQAESSAYLFASRTEAERVAAAIRSTYTSSGGHQIEVREVQP